jgi:hypothetical protein
VSTVIVTVDVGALVMGLISLGEKLTSIPDGAPVDDRVTVEEKPPIGITVSVASPDAPCATLIEFGTMEMSKSAGGPEEVTINWNAHECDCPPSLLVPVSERSYDSAGMFALTVKVTVETVEAPELTNTSVGENTKSTPDGTPLEDRDTVEEKLPIEVTWTFASAEPPCGTLYEFGNTEISKSGDGPEEVTVKVSESCCEASLAVAIRVSEYDPGGTLVPTVK